MKTVLQNYFLKVVVQYRKELYELQNELSFLPEKMNVGNVEKLFANFYDEKKIVIHIKNFKQPLRHGFILKKAQSHWIQSIR